MNINLAQETDLDAIQKVVETAFSDEENKIISKFAFDLLTETASPSIQSWVAEVDHQIIGSVSFSPIFLNLQQIFLDIFSRHLLCLQNIKNKVSVQASSTKE